MGLDHWITSYSDLSFQWNFFSTSSHGHKETGCEFLIFLFQFSERVAEAQRFAKMELKDFEEKKRAGKRNKENKNTKITSCGGLKVDRSLQKRRDSASVV